MLTFDEDFLTKLQKLLGDDKNEYKHPNYKACTDHAEEMGWHVYGDKPIKLLNRTRPREDPAITIYRLESYEPITQSVCKKALNISHKIFDQGLYSLKWDDKNDRARILKEYTTEKYPRFNSVINYLSGFVFKKMIADPNGVVLVQPFNYEIKESQRVQPIATCYGSKDIHLVDDLGRWFLLFDSFEQLDKDKVWHYTYVDGEAIYKLMIRMTTEAYNARNSVNSMGFNSSNQAVSITVEYQYNHNFGEPPVWYLMGEYSDKNYGVFESFFHPAVPFWNEAINDHSDVTGSYRMHMWPQKWEVADECEYVETGDAGGRFPCNNGYIFNADSGLKHKCQACGGTGKTAKSPYESHLVSRDKFLSADGAANIQVPFGYVTVPVEALTMLENKADRNLEKGLNALSMDVLNEIGLNQSGKAKEMDRTELNDFLKKLSDVIFDIHAKNIFYYFSKFMFGIEAPNPEVLNAIEPEISKASQFDVYSSVELTEQLGKAKTSKLSPSYLAAKQAQIQQKEFVTNKDLLVNLNLQLLLDPLAEINSDEVSLKLNTGTITQETAIIHDNIRVFISRALEEDKGFIDKTFQEQMGVLEEYAQEIKAKTRITIDTSAIEAQNQMPGNTATQFARQPVLKR